MTRCQQAIACSLLFSVLTIDVSDYVYAVEAQEGDNTQVYVTGEIFNSPDCSINNDKIIDVDFGDEMQTDQVDGVNYKKEINYTLLCSVSIGNGELLLKMAINGDAAGFDSSLFKTSKDELAIRIYANGVALSPTDWINFTYPNIPELYAVPVANGELSGGPFTGQATMIIDYQ